MKQNRMAHLSDWTYDKAGLRWFSTLHGAAGRWRHRRRYACKEGSGVGRVHGACVLCAERTCRRQMRVNPQSLRREMVFACSGCMWQLFRQDEPRRQERARRDWTRPLPDQFPGTSRSALKTFLTDGSEPEEVEVAAQPGVLNGSLGSLGLTRDAYAEQRSERTFLRRIRALNNKNQKED